MYRYKRICILLAVVIGLASTEAQAIKPNIILIMSDDVSPDLYGCYGNSQVHTPHLDRMAREGVKFETCWATAMCAPTRAMILTGRYGYRTGFYHNSLQIPQADGSNELLKYHHCFGKLLKQAGYATAIAGKWHCSSSRPEGPDGGFDEYCLWEGVREIGKLPGRPQFTGAWEDERTTSRYWHPGVIQNHKLVKTKPTDFGPDVYTNFLCDFMERKKDQPFLAYFPMVSPHGTRKGISTTPLRGAVGEMGKADTKAESDARFRALNEYIDAMVGRLWTKVEQLGLQERTILIYTSDNGTAVTAKTRAVERGCRVPFIVYGASVKQRGSTLALTDLTDILPTLIDFAGFSLPAGYAVDGKSLKPFLTGQSDTHREWIFSNIAASRLVRTDRYLLEAVNPMLKLPAGRLYDCGNSRDGRGYRRISDPTERALILEALQPILDRYPALTAEHPYWTSKRGKAFFREYTSSASVAKHLHNHKDYQFYNED